MFSKSYCPYCARARAAIAQAASEHSSVPAPHVVELDEIQNGTALQSALAQRAGRPSVTVPQVYVREQLVGGSDDVVAEIASGKFVRRLADA